MRLCLSVHSFAHSMRRTHPCHHTTCVQCKCDVSSLRLPQYILAPAFHIRPFVIVLKTGSRIPRTCARVVPHINRMLPSFGSQRTEARSGHVKHVSRHDKQKPKITFTPHERDAQSIFYFSKYNLLLSLPAYRTTARRGESGGDEAIGGTATVPALRRVRK